MEKKQSSNNVFKVSITADTKKREVSVKFKPNLTKETIDSELLQMYLNTLVSGFHVGMASLLAGIPILRAATQEEMDLDVYVFQGKDNDLFKARKQLYYSIAKIFRSILSEIFPDVEYIEGARIRQQEFIANKTPEEIEQYHQQVKDLVEKMKGEKE